MNLPSLDKYEPLVVPGGVLVVNTSMVNRPVQRTDLRTVLISGSDIAESLGDKRMTNMVLLGGLLANLPLMPIEALKKALAIHLPERHHKLLPMNFKALRMGATYLCPEPIS